MAFSIQEYLRLNPQILKTDKEVHVLNLSQPGNVILNQIVNFTLYGHQLAPDIVIAHQGFNDVVNGLVSDPNLLAKYHITYPDIMESWSRVIHDSTDPIDYDRANPNVENFFPVDIKNYLHQVSEAICLRTSQLAAYVQTTGSLFIPGLQPWIHSKQALSSSEADSAKTYKPYYRKVFSAVGPCFDMISSLLSNNPGLELFTNLHQSFSTASSSIDHFGDICHLKKRRLTTGSIMLH